MPFEAHQHIALCCAIAAGDVLSAQCACWSAFKPTWVAVNNMLPAAQKAQLQPITDLYAKVCSGFATSPSFLLIVAAALSMTLFTTRNPHE